MPARVPHGDHELALVGVVLGRGLELEEAHDLRAQGGDGRPLGGVGLRGRLDDRDEILEEPVAQPLAGEGLGEDPHWLYANWDLTREQLSKYNRQSADGHLVLRIYFAPPAGGLALEVHVHPESRHWFAHVDRAATKYVSELGYYSKSRKWVGIAKSGATLTLAETISDEAVAEFATIPAEVSFEELLALVQEAVVTSQPLARAVEELRREGHPELPAVIATPVTTWTPAQEQALAEVVSLDQVRRVWIGSMEITELVRRQLGRDLSSQSAAQLGRLTSPGGAVTSRALVVYP